MNKYDMLTDTLTELEESREHFCDNCPDRWDCGGMDYAYGAPVHVEELTCPGEGDPEDNGCTYHKDYVILLAEIDDVERDLEKEEENDE